MNLTMYREEVKRAKALLKRRAETKEEIIKIALDVCQIQQGGHIGGQVYTISKFAVDIGMVRKTLNHWILEYTDVTSKIPAKVRVPRDSDIIRRVRKKVGKNASGKLVRAVYIQEASYPPEEQDLLRYIRYADSYLYFLRSHAVKLLDPDTIAKCRELNGDTLDELISIQNKIKERLNG